MLKQNKGEWSELYVFLKLLGDGVLYAADSDMNKNKNLYYPIIEILRNENKQEKRYIKDNINIKVTDKFGKPLVVVPAKEFKDKAKLLLKTVRESSGAFPVPEIEEFMNIIKCSAVKAYSPYKSDITLVLHDCKTYRNETFGFSIKSRLGNSSTLLNSGNTTNFIYEIVGNLSGEQISQINKISTKAKIRDRLIYLKNLGCEIKYVAMQNQTFESNLQMIDTQFPLVISDFLVQYYLGTGNSVNELTLAVEKLNHCNLNMTTGQKYYEHKMKNFLTDVALGMTPAKSWDGRFQATGGYIIVREDGEVLCYHIYNHNEFQEYLFNNTRFETPSSSRYGFGVIYSESGKNYIKLNLQIRFI